MAEPDHDLEKFINSFKEEIDRKYNTLICKFATQLTHPQRKVETTLDNLIADAFAESSQTDVMLVSSGSIRIPSLGPLVTLKDFLACFPYDDSLTRFKLKGKKFIESAKKIKQEIMKKKNHISNITFEQQSTKVIINLSDDSTLTTQSLNPKTKPLSYDDDSLGYTIYYGEKVNGDGDAGYFKTKFDN